MADFDYLPAKFPKPGSSTYKGAVHIDNSGTLATGALALNKTSRVCRVPKGFVLTGWRFRIADGDSATALVFSVGDSGSAGRIASALTTGQAGGEVTAMNDAGFLYEFPADTDILFTATTAAGTPVAAAFKIALDGYMR